MTEEKQVCPRCGSEEVHTPVDFLKCYNCGWNEAYGGE